MFIKNDRGFYYNTNLVRFFDIDPQSKNHTIRAWGIDDSHFIFGEYPTEEQAKAELEKLVNMINEHDRPTVKHITVT